MLVRNTRWWLVEAVVPERAIRQETPAGLVVLVSLVVETWAAPAVREESAVPAAGTLPAPGESSLVETVATETVVQAVVAGMVPVVLASELVKAARVLGKYSPISQVVAVGEAATVGVAVERRNT